MLAEDQEEPAPQRVKLAHERKNNQEKPAAPTQNTKGSADQGSTSTSPEGNGSQSAPQGLRNDRSPEITSNSNANGEQGCQQLTEPNEVDR